MGWWHGVVPGESLDKTHESVVANENDKTKASQVHVV
jgi:hypothetical protein